MSKFTSRLDSYQKTTGGQRLHLDNTLNLRLAFEKTLRQDYQNMHLSFYSLSLVISPARACAEGACVYMCVVHAYVYVCSLVWGT